MTTNRYARETVEFQPATITVDGQKVTSGVEFAITPKAERPTVWEDAIVVDGEVGFMVEGYGSLPKYPATFAVWYRVTSDPETPVGRVGEFVIT